MGYKLISHLIPPNSYLPSLIIIAVYLLMMAIVPPQHEYPINDDWIYALSARNVLHGVFVIPGWAQASQLTHALWGAGFAALFGFSFTTLTWSMIVLAAIGSLTFYALLRRLDVGAEAALLGALLLACNPILIHLDYSFMTETSFLTYTLLACYCYLRGLQQGRDRWLWLGGAMTAIALLDRQFGVMVAVAALLYLLLKGQLNWRRAFAVALLPALALGGLLLWQASQPSAEISVQTNAHIQEFFHNPLGVIWEHLSRALIIIPVLGLFAPLALRWRSRLFAAYAAVLSAAVVGWYVYSGTVSFDYSRSNLFDSGGFMPPVLYYFRTITVGPPWLWLALSLVAALLTAGLLTAATAATIEWWHRPSPSPSRGEGSDLSSPTGGGWERAHAKALQPVNFVYLAGLLVGLLSLLLTTNFMDRYLVPLIPFLILIALRRAEFRDTIYPAPVIGRQGAINRAPTIRLGFYLSSLVFYLAFALIAQRDYFAYAQARWDAGQWVISQGVKYEQLDGGYEWSGWWLYDQAAAAIRGKPDVRYLPASPAGAGFPPDAVIDPRWRLEIAEDGGYHTVRQFGYTNWLAGGKTRYVLALKRNSLYQFAL
jgi:4-amino-4-deoxy-L-arabinose transferase-like glycosyltransferase